MKRLEGRVAVITGAGSGIGYATAKRFADEGAKVVVVDMNPETGNAVAKEVGGIFVAADVTNEEQVQAMYKTAFDTYGRIDIAFNNAGISPPDDDSILTTGIDAWRRVQEVNLTSVYLCCKYVLPYMQKGGKGFGAFAYFANHDATGMQVVVKGTAFSQEFGREDEVVAL